MGDLDYPKHFRLLKAKDFSPVFDKAEFKLSGRHLLILARSSALENPRLGLIVAKKHIATAVQRNRIKRILRESFRLHSREFATIDIVVLVRRGLDQLENREIRQEAENLLEKLVLKSNKAGTRGNQP